MHHLNSADVASLATHLMYMHMITNVQICANLQICADVQICVNLKLCNLATVQMWMQIGCKNYSIQVARRPGEDLSSPQYINSIRGCPHIT